LHRLSQPNNVLAVKADAAGWAVVPQAVTLQRFPDGDTHTVALAPRMTVWQLLLRCAKVRRD
jgi:hypothetical protein